MMAGYVAIGMVFFFLALTTFNKLFKVYKSKEIYDSNLMILIASILLHIGFIIARLADF